MWEFIAEALDNPTVATKSVHGSREHMYGSRKRSNSSFTVMFWPIIDFLGFNCERRFAAAMILAQVLAIALIPAALIMPTVLYAQGAMSTQTAGSLGDGNVELSNWTRGTTILIEGMRTFLKEYRQKLAERLHEPVNELAATIAKAEQPSLALQNHQFVMGDYEAFAEKEALAAGVDPRSVNPIIRAKFGELTVSSPDGNAEKLSDALNRGRAFRDMIFEAAYQATARGIEPLADVKVQTLLESYLQHRHRIALAIAYDQRRNTMHLENVMIFAFGVVFVATILALAFVFPDPTPFQYTIVRIILALSTAAVATLLTGFLTARVPG